MTGQIARLWSGIVAMVGEADEVVLERAAQWLRRDGLAVAGEYCAQVRDTLGLPRKMSGEHLVRMCCSVWAEGLGAAAGTPLLELLSRKAAEAPHRDHFGLWDGLWLPFAVAGGQLAAAAERQRSSPASRLRRDLERLLGVDPGASDEELQAAVDAVLRSQQREKRALAVGLPVDAFEDEVLEREEEFRLPDIRPVNGRFPEDDLAEYLRRRDYRDRVLGKIRLLRDTTVLPLKCPKCGRTVHDLAIPCRRDGTVCELA
jgi:hypothetical protein